MAQLKTGLTFKNGKVLKNPFALAPLTNKQSHENGELSDDEYQWLTKRAEGGFGMVMTCASHVQEVGKGFERQLGIFADRHIAGHRKLAASIQKHGSLAIIQLHHAGMRSPQNLIGQAPVCPSAHEKYSARALTLDEVKILREDFIKAAIRAKESGYDGVEVHGAHGYILTQFLSKKHNLRNDEYGGNLENRARLLFEIVYGIRETCGSDFLLGVRLSPERFGMNVAEIKSICRKLIDEGNIDFLDISLWDCFKMPEDENYQNKTLLEHFTDLDYKDVLWTVAGNIRTGQDVHKVLDKGVNFVSIGRSGILHHNFPQLVSSDPNFIPIKNPVSQDYLRQEGLGEKFIEYMKRWNGFVLE